MKQYSQKFKENTPPPYAAIDDFDAVRNQLEGIKIIKQVKLFLNGKEICNLPESHVTITHEILFQAVKDYEVLFVIMRMHVKGFEKIGEYTLNVDLGSGLEAHIMLDWD